MTLNYFVAGRNISEERYENNLFQSGEILPKNSNHISIFHCLKTASAEHDIAMNTVSHTLFHFAEGVAQRIDPLD